jgi:hypothetical protein
MGKIGLAGLLLSGVLLMSANAFAEVTSTEGGEGEYGYEFEDDPLAAAGFGPNDDTIRIRPGAARTTLIKPRTTFVPEMLKSVENL